MWIMPGTAKEPLPTDSDDPSICGRSQDVCDNLREHGIRINPKNYRE
jgi:hypothetical protein